MEPVRPVVDGFVIDLVQTYVLAHADVHETREGLSIGCAASSQVRPLGRSGLSLLGRSPHAARPSSRPGGPAEREDPASRVLREPSVGQGPAPGSRGLGNRAALGAAGPTGDADSRDQHSGGSPTDSPTGLDEWSVRSVRPASPGTRAIAAPASHDERAPRLMRSSRSQRTTSRHPAWRGRGLRNSREATVWPCCRGVPLTSESSRLHAGRQGTPSSSNQARDGRRAGRSHCVSERKRRPVSRWGIPKRVRHAGRGRSARRRPGLARR